MIELTGLTPEETEKLILDLSEPKYRAAQVYAWVQKGRDITEMHNLPRSLRAKLEETACAQAVLIERELVSSLDGTRKFLFRLRDGNCIEGVLMQYEYGYTLCVSTQVGCRMGCRFCASTLDGCVRNLSAGEILGEVVAVQRLLEEKNARIRNVVLMGSGEPFDNYDAVVRFLRLANDERGQNISLRHISLSTCGLVPEMLRFADEGLPVTLSISLHAPNDRIRRQIMPISQRYSVREVLDAAKVYLQKTGRRVIFEYALIRGVNAGCEHAEELAALLRGMQCHVNVIPLNAVPERHLEGVSEAEVTAFLKTLEKNHISATRRREMGDDIEGACGQLRKKTMREEQADANRF